MTITELTNEEYAAFVKLVPHSYTTCSDENPYYNQDRCRKCILMTVRGGWGEVDNPEFELHIDWTDRE